MSTITRRTFLAGASIAAVSSDAAMADGKCPGASFYQPFNAPVCNAFVDPKGIRVSSQTNSEWCWAATISNLFGYYDHPVSQETIVEAGIHNLVNKPATLEVIKSVLDRDWTDQNGDSFTSRAKILYSKDEPVPIPSNAEIIGALQSNRPLLYCNMSHAMMLVSVNYVPPLNRPGNVVASIVVDPWPGLGLRALTQAELIPGERGGQWRLLMQVTVS